MYQAFFGFTQQPFSIAPDPRFLFLGPRHQEGLAHLHHGLMGSGGFLLLTGEVGTGKTTLSRAILSQLEDQLHLVFILNPRLSEQELLASIAQGFGIEGVDETDSLKLLTDAIASFLTASAEQGKHPVVLIDEAQHLYPAALEQLRLLTNLESDAKKLLSVVLIGQPELRMLLQRQELRQVAQRIVARYQLLPFTQAETNEYIEHRLTVAEGATSIFSPKAKKYIWQVTQGTPRLINLICDRALQLAAMQGSKHVDRRIIKNAADVLPLAQENTKPRQVAKWWPWLAAAVVIALAGWRLGPLWLTPSEQPAPPDMAQETSVYVRGQSLHHSLAELAGLWQLGDLSLGQQPCERLVRYNISCVYGHANLTQVATLDVPAIATLLDGSSIMLRGLQGRQWLVQDALGQIQMDEASLSAMLRGEFFLLVSPPSFVNDVEAESWHAWVTARLNERVPLSLRESDIDQQRTWLLDTAQGISNDDAWLFALLATAGDYQGPRLSTVSVADKPEQRQRMAESSLPEQVRYGNQELTLADLRIPEFILHWPSEESEEKQSVQIEGGQEAEALSATDPVTDSQPLTENSPQGSQRADALQTIFEEAVRATPERARETRWSFDLDEPTQSTPNQQQGIPLLAELTAEQRELLPKLTYDQHVYQSNPSARWIGLGQHRLAEGELIQGLRVISIQPNYSILAWGDLLFRVEALESL